MISNLPLFGEAKVAAGAGFIFVSFASCEGHLPRFKGSLNSNTLNPVFAGLVVTAHGNCSRVKLIRIC